MLPLRDIEICLTAELLKLYHMGFRDPGTVIDAGRCQRDARMGFFAGLSHRPIAQARKLYTNESLGIWRDKTRAVVP